MLLVEKAEIVQVHFTLKGDGLRVHRIIIATRRLVHKAEMDFRCMALSVTNFEV